jgi:hypothetical protein
MALDYTPINYYSQMNAAQWSGVTAVAAASSSWLRRAQQKLKELSELTENWDSYGSRPIQQKASETAAELLTETANFGLPEPQIFPVPGGGLQLEWESAKRELELEILPDGEIEYLIVDREGKMRENKISPSWMDEIYRLVSWFKNSNAGVDKL